jgi:hypothetical protein
MLSDDNTNAINGFRTISFTINNVLTPPSLKFVNGFIFRTMSSDGYLIDQNSETSSQDITYHASTIDDLPSSQVSVSSTDTSINAVSDLTI